MDEETVYDADTWPVVACSERRSELCDWLRANGVDPTAVPVGEDVTIEPLTLGGERAIHYTVLLRNAEGHFYRDEDTDGAAQAACMVPLVAQPPPHWLGKESS
ncbi:hypothetical protein [Streptomyces sp. NPDC057302]|uniref:hypothetical protein n=1 Tax=Streptomyces sp. NPDC057302 TaxID=3346094 RepID=UPI00363D5004